MKIATFNLRHHADRWEERFQLVVETLLATGADLIGLQEVSLKLGPKNQAEIIAEAMNGRLDRKEYSVCFKEARGYSKGKEGIAILSKIPVLEVKSVALPKLWRVAQMAKVMVNGQEIGFVNTHLHHEPLHSEEVRYPQAEYVMNWALSQAYPCIIVGDFNAQPYSSTIEMMKDNYSSAFESLHGKEPEFTWPTPLVGGTVSADETEMIDYVFFNPTFFNVVNCKLIGNAPPPEDTTLYPSDHFGVFAEFKIIN